VNEWTVMALGTGELLLLAVIAVIFLGPKEVYKIAHKMGGWMREIQKMSQEFMRELNREADSIERVEKSLSANKNVFMTGGSATAATGATAAGTTPSISDSPTEPMVTDDNPASVLGGPNAPPEVTPEAAPVAEPEPASESPASAESISSEPTSTDEEKSSS